MEIKIFEGYSDGTHTFGVCHKELDGLAQFDENGYFTGKFATSNCNYQEKKKRIEEEIDLSFYDEVIAFGDTEGDKIMFSLATKSCLKSVQKIST